jgi:hypothetical protein
VTLYNAGCAASCVLAKEAQYSASDAGSGVGRGAGGEEDQGGEGEGDVGHGTHLEESGGEFTKS